VKFESQNPVDPAKLWADQINQDNQNIGTLKVSVFNHEQAFALFLPMMSRVQIRTLVLIPEYTIDLILGKLYSCDKDNGGVYMIGHIADSMNDIDQGKPWNMDPPR